MREQTGASNARIVAAFETAYALLHGAELRHEIDELDNKVPAQRQMALNATLAAALTKYTHGILKLDSSESIVQMVTALAPNADALETTPITDLPAYLKAVLQRRVNQLSRDGVPTSLAENIGKSLFMANAPLLHRLTRESGSATEAATEAYIQIGNALSLDRLRAAAEQAIADMPYWDRLATRGLTRELEALQVEATKLALAADSPASWLSEFDAQRSELISDLKRYTGSKPNFAQFALAADAVRKFMQSAS